MQGQTFVAVLGTVVTIVGLVIVAPYEAGRMVAELWRATLWLARKAQTTVKRVLPFLYEKQVSEATGAAGLAVATTSASATVRVALGSDSDVLHRLNILEQAVSGIWNEVDALRKNQNEAVKDLRARAQTNASDIEALRRAVDEHYQNAQDLNARGFPLAAVGAVLANIPQFFVGWWWLILFVPLCWVAVAPLGKTATRTVAEIARGARRYEVPPAPDTGA